MSDYVIGQTYRKDFQVSDPIDASAVDADSLPAIEIYENGGTASMSAPTPAKRDTGTTGQYSFSVALTGGNGFEVDKTYNVYAIAIVGGTTGKALIDTFVVRRVTTYFG